MQILFYFKKRIKYVLKREWLRYILLLCILYTCEDLTIYASPGLLGNGSLIQFLCYSAISSYSIMKHFVPFPSFTFFSVCLLSRSLLLVFSSSRKYMYKLINILYYTQTLYIFNSSTQKTVCQ